jgi:hypothetical protein
MLQYGAVFPAVADPASVFTMNVANPRTGLPRGGFRSYADLQARGRSYVRRTFLRVWRRRFPSLTAGWPGLTLAVHVTETDKEVVITPKCPASRTKTLKSRLLASSHHQGREN